MQWPQQDQVGSDQILLLGLHPDWLLYEIIGKVIFEGSVLGKRPTINLKTFPGH